MNKNQTINVNVNHGNGFGGSAPGTSMAVAFLLWLFLGTLGAHRFYTKDIGYAIFIMIIGIVSLMTVVLYPLFGVFLLVDGYFLYKRVQGLQADVVAQQTAKTEEQQKMSAPARIAEYKKLLDDNAISQEQYDAAISDLL